eukprot:XP_024455930.1 protein smg8 [Populus trichocarpa]
MDPLDIAVSLMENSRGLNRKVSTMWREKALPTAKDEYLKGLPVCHPTAQHEVHLEKAMRVFLSMVRGPAVLQFAKKLEDECSSIWKSGRQLCDAVSLTGKQCMHQRHSVDNGVALTAGAAVKPHSKGSNIGQIQSSSWSLIRVADARYYESSKGLLQSGFSSTHKFLSKCTIFLEKPTNLNGLPATNVQQASAIRSSTDPQVDFNGDVDRKKTVFFSGDMDTGVENQRKLSVNSKLYEKEISFGRIIPNFTMRKPFSEVVAGLSAADSGFRIPSHRKQHPSISEKEILHGKASNGGLDGDSSLQIGSNVVPMNTIGGEVVKSSKHAIVYVGFEHECPHGHRFLLSLDHLNELGSLYPLPEESHVPSMETSDNSLADPSNLGRNSSTGKGHRSSKDKAVATANELRNTDKSKEMGLSKNKKDPPEVKFAGTISQLQRIFLVTPPSPVVLATCPVIQFATVSKSCNSALDVKWFYHQSFLTLRLPFVCGVQLEDGNPVPLNAFESQPEMTAWIMKGTTLQVVTKNLELKLAGAAKKSFL